MRMSAYADIASFHRSLLRVPWLTGLGSPKARLRVALRDIVVAGNLPVWFFSDLFLARASPDLFRRLLSCFFRETASCISKTAIRMPFTDLLQSRLVLKSLSEDVWGLDDVLSSELMRGLWRVRYGALFFSRFEFIFIFGRLLNITKECSLATILNLTIVFDGPHSSIHTLLEMLTRTLNASFAH